MLYFKKYFMEIVVGTFLIIFMLHFAPIAFGATVDYANPEPNWKYELTEQLYGAYALFAIDCNNDRDHDMTDMDCSEISQRLQNRIDLILFSFRNELAKESAMNIYYDEQSEYELARHEDELLENYHADLMEGKQD